MSNRLPQPDRLTAQVVTPVATPVDRYEKTAAGQSLAQLSESLLTLAPALSRFTEFASGIQNEKDKVRAETDMANSRATYAQAVQSGLIAETESPWYKMYAKRMLGKMNAAQYEGDLVAFQNTELQGVSIEEYDQRVSEFHAEWIKKNGGDEDPQFLQGFAEGAASTEYSHRTSYITEFNKKMVSDTDNAYYGTLRTSLNQELMRKDVPQFGAPDYQASLEARVGELLTTTMRDAVAHGMSGRKASDSATQAVLDLAAQGGHPELIQALMKAETTPGSYLGYRKEWQARIQDALEQARAAKSSIEHGRQLDAEAATRGLVKSLQIQVLDASFSTSANAFQLNATPEWNALKGLDPDKANDLLTWRKNLIANGTYHDEEKNRHLLTAIWDTTNGAITADDVIRMYNADPAGITVEDARSLLSQVAARDSAQSTAFHDDALDAGIRRSVALFEQAYKGDGSGENARQFDKRMRADFAMWRAGEGKNATIKERMDWVASHEEILTASLLPSYVVQRLNASRAAIASKGEMPVFPTITSSQLSRLTTAATAFYNPGRDKKDKPKAAVPIPNDLLQLLGEQGIDNSDKEAVFSFLELQRALLIQFPDDGK